MKKIILSAVALSFLFLGLANVPFITEAQSNPPTVRVTGNFVPDEVLVKFKKNEIDTQDSYGQIQALVFSILEDLEKKADLEQMNTILYRLESETETVGEAIARLQADPSVEYVQPNYIYYPLEIPNDSSFNQQWGLNNTGQSVNGTNGTSDADIDAPEAWDQYDGEAEIIVAIIDTGVDYTHVELDGLMWDGSSQCFDESGNAISGGCPNSGWNYTKDELNANDPMYNTDDHGTHVAGIVTSETNNNTGIAGTGRGIKLMAIRSSSVNGGGEVFYSDDLANSVNFARNNGAKIINASLGGGASSCSAVYDQLFYEAIANFDGLFLAAAGNDNTEHDGSTYFEFPADYGTNTSCWNGLDNVISIASTNSNDGRSSFSDYGANFVHVGAPGSDIYSTLPDNSLGFESGTSMATPMVSGVAGTLWSHSPTRTTSEIKNILLTTGDDLAALNGITTTGKRVNFNNAITTLEKPTINSFSLRDIGTNNTSYTSGNIAFTINAIDNNNIGGENDTFERYAIFNNSDQEVLDGSPGTGKNVETDGSFSAAGTAGALTSVSFYAEVTDKDGHTTQSETDTITIDKIAPTNLLIENFTNGSTSISFNFSTSDEGIGEVEIKYCPTSQEDETCSDWTTETSYIRSELIPNTQYPLYTKVRDTLGNEGDFVQTSNYRTFAATADISNPMAQILSQNAGTTNEIQLNWNLANGIKVTISRDTSDLACNAERNEILSNSTDTSLVDTSLASDTDYYYRLFAVNADNETNTTDCVKVRQRTIPPQVQNLQVIQNAVNQDETTATVTWEWNGVFETSDYKFYLNEDPAIDVSGTTNYTKNDLPLNTSVNAQVSAVRSGEEGEKSTPLSMITGSSKPQDLGFSDKTTSTITWTWGEGTSNGYYARVEKAGQEVHNSGWLSNSTYSWQGTGYEPNIQYTLYVKAKNLNDEETEESSYDTYTSISTPASVSATNITNSGFAATTPELENVNDGNSAYYFDIGSQNSGWSKNPSWNVSELTGNTSYPLSVKARNVISEETESFYTNVLTLPDTPELSFGVPTNNSQTAIINSNGPMEYLIDISTDPNFGVYDNVLNWETKNNGESVVFENLETDTTYYVRTKSRNASGESVENIQSFEMLRYVYLNGTEDKYINIEEFDNVTLSLSAENGITVEVYNAEDIENVLLSKTSTGTSVDFSNSELKTAILNGSAQNTDIKLAIYRVDAQENRTADNAQIIFNIDRIAPQISVTSHENNEGVDTAQITLSGSFTETDLNSIQINDIPASINANNWSLLVGLEVEQNTFEIVAIDKAGNGTDISLNIIRQITISAVESEVTGLNDVTITWKTDGQSINNKVFLGVDEENLTEYQASEGAGINHRVDISGLTGETTYIFRVQSEKDGFAINSDFHSFQTPTTVDIEVPQSIELTDAIYMGTDTSITFTGSGENEIVLVSIEEDYGQITLPGDIKISVNGENWNGIIEAPSKIEKILSEAEIIRDNFYGSATNVGIVETFRVGNKNQGLNFSKLIKTVISVPDANPGDMLHVFYSHDNRETWNKFTPSITCEVTANKKCELHLPNFSDINLVTLENQNCTTDDWLVGAWSSCEVGNQSRTISKKNNCVGEGGKPEDSRPCEENSSIGAGSGKAKTLRWSGMKREDLRKVLTVDPEQWKIEYKESLKDAEQSQKGLPGEVVKRDRDGKKQFVGYLPGRVATDRFKRQKSDININEFFYSVAKTPKKVKLNKLIPKFTTMNAIDVSPQNEVYEEIAKVISLEVLKPNKYHKFQPNRRLNWTELLEASLRTLEVQPQSMLTLWEADLPQIKGIPLILPEKVQTPKAFRRISTYYTALNLGLIEANINPQVAPTRAETLKVLVKAFELHINPKAKNSSFQDIASDDPLTPWIIAAKKKRWPIEFSERYFRPDRAITRKEFAHWFGVAYDQKIAREQLLVKLKKKRSISSPVIIKKISVPMENKEVVENTPVKKAASPLRKDLTKKIMNAKRKAPEVGKVEKDFGALLDKVF